MGTDYDAWLEKPYREQSEGEQRYEASLAKFIVSDLYKEDLADWLEENTGKTEGDFRKTDWFETCLDYFSSNYTDSDDYEDDDRDPPSYLMNW